MSAGKDQDNELFGEVDCFNNGGNRVQTTRREWYFLVKGEKPLQKGSFVVLARIA